MDILDLFAVASLLSLPVLAFAEGFGRHLPPDVEH